MLNTVCNTTRGARIYTIYRTEYIESVALCEGAVQRRTTRMHVTQGIGGLLLIWALTSTYQVSMLDKNNVWDHIRNTLRKQYKEDDVTFYQAGKELIGRDIFRPKHEAYSVANPSCYVREEANNVKAKRYSVNALTEQLKKAEVLC